MATLYKVKKEFGGIKITVGGRRLPNKGGSFDLTKEELENVKEYVEVSDSKVEVVDAPKVETPKATTGK